LQIRNVEIQHKHIFLIMSVPDAEAYSRQASLY
jgi:hypothetical protein